MLRDISPHGDVVSAKLHANTMTKNNNDVTVIGHTELNCDLVRNGLKEPDSFQHMYIWAPATADVTPETERERYPEKRTGYRPW